jgi:valyl-tRNA synthetase
LTLGYPNGDDYKKYYPTDLMETGSDLVFKWVPRMILFGLYLDGRIPFKNLYFHGMVNDEKNQKMSKSKGNVISPIDLSDKFGTDALRMALVMGNAPGSNVSLAENKVKGYKHFANKVWNIARFVLANTEGVDLSQKPELMDQDQKIIDEFRSVAEKMTQNLEDLRFDLAADKIYHYLWHVFADIVIEESKKRLNEGTEAEKISAKRMLLLILRDSLKLLHPFMPFVTEEIYGFLPVRDKKDLIVESWPKI